MSITVAPIWFDSLGAKSSCTLIKTPEASVVIDPGIAALQPSFPADEDEKERWKAQGRKAIVEACKKAGIMVISHYHHDHYFPDDFEIYAHKLIFAKNPNEYINDSQRKRSLDFYTRLCERYGKDSLYSLLQKRGPRVYHDPLVDHPIAMAKDFGRYNERRSQLLDLGRGWFEKRVEKWRGSPEIPELRLNEVEVRFPEGRVFNFGETRLRFTPPFFHGIEYSRVGWIFSTVIERDGVKVIHSSDMNGPIIEDYAAWLIEENPTILILDGPMTYMRGYLLNKINLNRAIRNVSRVIREVDAEVIIYDHHLPREPEFKENTWEAWETARRLHKNLLTAAEYLGKTPKALEHGEE